MVIFALKFFMIFSLGMGLFAHAEVKCFSTEVAGNLCKRVCSAGGDCSLCKPCQSAGSGGHDGGGGGDVKANNPNQIAEANKLNKKAINEKTQQGSKFVDDGDLAKKLGLNRVNAADNFVKKGGGQSQLSPQTKAGFDHDRPLVARARNAVEEERIFPRKEAVTAINPEVRNNLLLVSKATEVKQTLSEEKKRTDFELSQLLQMAATTLQAATAMNSLDSNSSPSQNKQNIDLTAPVAPKAALASRKPASLGDKEGSVSEKSEDPALADGGKAAEEKSAKDKETIAKVKAEVEAAEKRKKIQAMRLKQKLRDKANAQGKGNVDTDELFGGSLRQGQQEMESAEGGGQAEESAAKESAMSAPSVYQAVKEGFSLAGAETDREVGQIVAEAERDLSSEEMSAGVLGRESPSLFVRVHAVHEVCQRQKCVFAIK